MEHWQRKSLKAALLADDVPPEFELIYEPMMHIECKGNTFISQMTQIYLDFLRYSLDDRAFINCISQGHRLDADDGLGTAKI